MFYGRIFSLFLVTVVYSLFVSVMAGRPSARTFIVPVDEIFSIEAIKSEKWTMKVISANIGGKEEVLIWLAKHRLIRNSVNCTRCAGPARLNK
jgi:hypothetical protein